AKVYFSLLNPDAQTEPVQEGLQRAAGFLRSRLGKDLQIRYVPELRFIHDDSIAHGAEISRLIDNATASHNDDSDEKDPQ
ncbi:MAG TPA: 30S ribosome-binding factor RbfA, partial [Woeseiaceae bacterium]